MQKSIIGFILFAAFMVVTVVIGCKKDEVAQSKTVEVTQASSNEVFAFAVAKAVSCQCLKHVRNCTGLPANANSVSAKDYGQVLSQNSYTSTSGSGTPKVDDIVVFQSGFGGGINATHGHIGFIISKEQVGTGNSAYWKIKIKSANWTNSNTYTQCDCTNVENSGWINVNTATRKTNIAYWRK